MIVKLKLAFKENCFDKYNSYETISLSEDDIKRLAFEIFSKSHNFFEADLDNTGTFLEHFCSEECEGIVTDAIEEKMERNK